MSIHLFLYIQSEIYKFLQIIVARQSIPPKLARIMKVEVIELLIKD